MSREARREQIMNAVVELVAQEGLAAATVRRIACQLQCSPGQIHHHFDSAEALRAEAVREVWRRLEPLLVAALRKLSPRERLITVLSGCKTQILGEDDPLLRVAERLWSEAWETRRDSAVRAAIVDGVCKMRDEVCASLAEGVAAEDFPEDLDVNRMSLLLIAASQGFDFLEEVGIEQELGIDKRAYMIEVMRREGL
ncbi:TetR family transcriptional regulator [Pseudomonas sp. GX19020]|uniref:TetR family transcriptional regulator n=1 Tax=Pseudomonadota TaxID=1224 RepID=UPI000B88A197|nr:MULTISPECIES: TetR family transcriptional regulator [Pseudomonadota]MCL4067081.1 TetR family transcriptional regulator [Pseudomonas sp. GX19020]